jgi:hypothetical protein
LCFGSSGVWKWRLTNRTSSAVPRSSVRRIWQTGTWRTSRQRQGPLQSAVVWRVRTGWVVRCTAMWYSGVWKCHCCQFIGSCRWSLDCYVIQQGVWSATAVCSLRPAGGLWAAMWYSRLCEVPLLSFLFVLQVESCTVLWYSRLCEVSLLSVHCVLQVEPTMCPPWQASLL